MLWRNSNVQPAGGNGYHYFIVGEVPSPSFDIPQLYPDDPSFNYWNNKFNVNRNKTARLPNYAVPVYNNNAVEAPPLQESTILNRESWEYAAIFLKAVEGAAEPLSNILAAFRITKDYPALLSELNTTIQQTAMSSVSRVGGVLTSAAEGLLNPDLISLDRQRF